MKEFKFTLRFAVNERIAEGALLDRLFEAGCEDALIAYCEENATVSLEFAREDERPQSALRRAMDDVERGLPAARLVLVEWDDMK